MKYKITYGRWPKFTPNDRQLFDTKGFECKCLMLTPSGAPVAILHSEDYDIWRVSYGFSSVFFGTYEDAMDYCEERFCDLDGKRYRR